MASSILLEITVDTLEAAVAAQRAGAQRIELCEDLTVGGITPGNELLRGARRAVQLPVFSMVRPRGGDFVFSEAEFEAMARSIECARRAGMDGLVFGLLHGDGTVDAERTSRLVELAKPLEVTFHRAFDAASDLDRALEAVISTGATRILTSGGKRGAAEGLAELAGLVRKAGSRIGILPGGGVNAGNIATVVERTGAVEIHSGLSTALPYPRNGHDQFEAEVRNLVAQLGKFTAPASSRA